MRVDPGEAHARGDRADDQLGHPAQVVDLESSLAGRTSVDGVHAAHAGQPGDPSSDGRVLGAEADHVSGQ